MSSSNANQKDHLSNPETWTCECVHVFSGHSGWLSGVRSVAISQDGCVCASGSDDQTIKVWNLNTGQELFTLSKHTQRVRTLAFSLDGMILASGSDDGSIKLWNLKTGRNTATLLGHTESVTSVAFRSDGKVLVSGSDDKTVKLWNLTSCKEIKTLLRHSNYIQSVAFSPDGRIVASAGCDYKIKLKHIDGNHETLAISGHSNTISAVAFSPDGNFLASGSHDKTIKLWNTTTGQEITTLSSGVKVNSLSISSDGQAIISGDDDGSMRLYSLKTENLLYTLSGHSNGVSSVAFDGNTRTIISGDYGNQAIIWWIEKPQPTAFEKVQMFFSNRQEKNAETEKMPEFIRLRLEQNRAWNAQQARQEVEKNQAKEAGRAAVANLITGAVLSLLNNQSGSSTGDTYIHSYYKQDGTHVRGHWRQK